MTIEKVKITSATQIGQNDLIFAQALANNEYEPLIVRDPATGQAVEEMTDRLDSFAGGVQFIVTSVDPATGAPRAVQILIDGKPATAAQINQAFIVEGKKFIQSISALQPAQLKKPLGANPLFANAGLTGDPESDALKVGKILFLHTGLTVSKNAMGFTSDGVINPHSDLGDIDPNLAALHDTLLTLPAATAATTPVSSTSKIQGSKLKAMVSPDGKQKSTLAAMMDDPANVGKVLDGAKLTAIFVEGGALDVNTAKQIDPNVTNLFTTMVNPPQGAPQGTPQIPLLASLLGGSGWALSPNDPVTKKITELADAKKPLTMNGLAALLSGDAKARLVQAHPEAKNQDVPAIVTLFEAGYVTDGRTAVAGQPTQQQTAPQATGFAGILSNILPIVQTVKSLFGNSSNLQNTALAAQYGITPQMLSNPTFMTQLAQTNPQLYTQIMQQGQTAAVPPQNSAAQQQYIAQMQYQQFLAQQRQFGMQPVNGMGINPMIGAYNPQFQNGRVIL
jgi:hypothetical protein